MSSIIIVGAGWAGLSCAYELTKSGHKVTVIEAAPQIGGRARAVQFNDQVVDNGQHIALGAYNTMRGLMHELNLDPHKLFKILPMQIVSYGQRQQAIKLPSMPVPINLLAGILTARNMPWAAKLQILRLAHQLASIKYQLKIDMSILELLQNYHQSSYVIEHFWEPIALAAMSTAISKASAQIFCNVLRQVFAANASHSNWYLPTVDLTTLLPTAIAQYVQNFDNQIICNQSIKQIEFVNGKARVLSNANAWTADHVVLATPPWQTEKILQAHATLQPLCTNLQAFNFESITTIYYKFSQAVQLPYPILSTLHSTCQWIFDRAFAAQPNILSAVITGPAAHAYDANHVLSDIVLKEISLHFPALSDPIAYKVIREKRAAFSCDVTIQQHRPRPATAYKNLWLCGDYLQTGLPATLEGALLSGKQTCSELLKTC